MLLKNFAFKTTSDGGEYYQVCTKIIIGEEILSVQITYLRTNGSVKSWGATLWASIRGFEFGSWTAVEWLDRNIIHR